MTVKELKEMLNQFPDDLIVMIPNFEWHVAARNVSRGINELDGYLFIDDYAEED